MCHRAHSVVEHSADPSRSGWWSQVWTSAIPYMANQKECHPHAKLPGETLIAEPERVKRELPEAVRVLIEPRIGDTVYVNGTDYIRVHWHSLRYSPWAE